MQRFSKTLNNVLSVSRVEKPILVGHSFGGMIALQYAVEHPDKVKALVLASTSDADPAKLNNTISLDAIVSDIKRRLIESGGQKRGEVYPFDKNPELSDEEMINIGLAYTIPKALAGSLEATRGYDVRDKLSTIKFPTLILRGENDTVIIAKMAETMGKRISGSIHLTVYASGHNLIFQRPKLFTGMVESNLGYLRR